MVQRSESFSLKILGIETSSPLFSLCINEDDKLLYEIRKNRLTDEKSRDAQFFAEAQRLIEYFGRETIGAVAISIGPGMFTSLRVGLGLAKGLALAQHIPVVAVNTLDVIGLSATFIKHQILATINAYHQEIYAALFKNGRRLTAYLLTTPSAVDKLIKTKTMIIGSGVAVFQRDKAMYKNDKFHFVDDENLLPTALKVVKIALQRIQSGQFDTPEDLEPFYIKKTDAERHYNKTNAF